MSSIDDASRKRALESIERNAQAQGVLINDLLECRESSAAGCGWNPDTGPCGGGARGDRCGAARSTGKEIEFSVSLAPVTGEVRGDPDRLQQVIWNLLSNAVKFTPPSGRVSLKLEETGGAVQIAVTDTGTGIDPDVPAARVRALPPGR